MAAQRDVAGRYGHACPRAREGIKARLVLRVFAPIYRTLSWRMRSFVLQSMPGSHPKTWTPRERQPLGPAVQPPPNP
jgi:hypothetical protein